MFDGSSLPIEENIAKTTELVNADVYKRQVGNQSTYIRVAKAEN